MIHIVEVTKRLDAARVDGAALTERFNALTHANASAIWQTRIFFLEDVTGPDALERICTELLCDDVIETAQILLPKDREQAKHMHEYIEVSPLAGVTDSVGETLLKRSLQLPEVGVSRSATATRYHVAGDFKRSDLEHFARQQLANEVVEQWSVNEPLSAPFADGVSAQRIIETVPVMGLDDEALLALSSQRRLSLDLYEMRTIRDYYRESNREPTDLELEMLAQTWSEHCVHKTFKALVSYHELSADGVLVEGSERVVDSMIHTYLKGATDNCGKDFIRSAFVDNAGIVRFDDEFDLAIKAETHNHPSALEPFGGANTGVGGVVRDILGVSARPIANTDVLCFGPQDKSDSPDGVLHPARIKEGVIAGVEDYGNKMGIPTVNGAIVFEEGYTANPLVFVGCIGILPSGAHPTQPRPGDKVVVLGGRTGRDGLRGATFSSMEMDHSTGDIAGTAVQIGHPIHEKQAQEVVCAARDERLYHAITDCGAGGLSSSVGEMAEKLGADVFLEQIPLKYSGLQPWEVWLSEAQERMVMAVPESNLERLLEICAVHETEASIIGAFRDDGILRVTYEGDLVGAFDVKFLHDGMPQLKLDAVWQQPRIETAVLPSVDIEQTVIELLRDPNLCSRSSVIRRYDHEVQGGTAVKPLVGNTGEAPGDAAVLIPLAVRQRGRTNRGAAVGCGVNPRYGAIDPYLMAWACVDEAVRNVVSVGADPDEISLLDNFCWGNPRLPDRMGGLLRCAEGCGDAALAFGAPYVSGKDSLNNEFTGADGQKHSIPGTILITALGIVPDTNATTHSTIYDVGAALYLVGETRDELGGSALVHHLKTSSSRVPKPTGHALTTARAIHQSLRAGLVSACHDCSEGGLGIALAEMIMDSEVGLTVDLAKAFTENAISDVSLLFSESLSRYLVAVQPAQEAGFLAQISDLPHGRIGESNAAGTLEIIGQSGARYQWRNSQLFQSHHSNPKFLP
jgi:phosphoribosylformylglycinamidine synthase subunit PurSL